MLAGILPAGAASLARRPRAGSCGASHTEHGLRVTGKLAACIVGVGFEGSAPEPIRIAAEEKSAGEGDFTQGEVAWARFVGIRVDFAEGIPHVGPRVATHSLAMKQAFEAPGDIGGGRGDCGGRDGAAM